MMDLDDGVDSTPGLTDHPGRQVPFLGAQQTIEKQQQLNGQQNGYKQQMGTNNLTLRHNSALAVSIETDV